jgi:5-methylthioadenosine/S-adenosylhomocysteine deaminase
MHTPQAASTQQFAQQLTEPGGRRRPVAFRNATVITVDPARGTLRGCDVLVTGDSISAVGPSLDVPEGTLEIDGAEGILMPGMVDTHRHMWQTALRGYGADWSLTNYFYFFYINWGKLFRPQDVYAGNLLAAIESVDAGTTTTLDWSHGLRTVEHGEAAADALDSVPGRFVLGYGNLAGSPWEWANSPGFRAFARRRIDAADDMHGFQLAFDITGEPSFPERGAFEAARDLGVPVTTHSGVWKVTTDDAIRLMAEHGCLTDQVTHVHCGSLSEDSYQRIAASGGCASLAPESECSAGQGYPPSFTLRKHGIPISLSVDTSVWWNADMFSAMRALLNTDRVHEHLEHHERDETCLSLRLRAKDVVEYATQGGASALRLGGVIGSITPGKKADLILIQNAASPVMFPLINPEGHVVYQAGRADVHTVMVNGRVLKHDHRLLLDDLMARARSAVTQTVDYLRGEMGEQAWDADMHPAQPDVELIANPYQYSEYKRD